LRMACRGVPLALGEPLGQTLGCHEM
jgi:hypothetical protein